MQELIRYETARRALAEAHAVDEVKDIRDKALALEAYARQAKNYEMEIMAAEIRVRAEHRAGELLKEVDKQGPGQYQQRSSDTSVDIPPTLAERGITYDQSSRWQKLVEVPEEKFEQHLHESAANFPCPHRPAPCPRPR